MATVKLTKAKVDALIPGKTPTYLWDAEIKGFGLRCSPGGIKAFVFQYRTGGGGRNAQKQRITIGKYGSPWTPEMARIEAKNLAGLVANGGDPSDSKRLARSAITLGDLIDEYQKAGEAGLLMTKRGTPKKPTTVASDKGRLKHHIRPALGRKRLEEISDEDVRRLFADVKSGKSVRAQVPPDEKRTRGSIPRGGVGAAAQCVALVSALFAYAVETGVLPRGAENPARGVKTPKPRKMDRYLKTDELGALANAITAYEENGGNVHAAGSLRLLIFTGARRAEILSAKREWVDAERGFLFLPDSKSGAKPIFLNAPALAVIAALPTVKDNPHLSPGHRIGQHLRGIDKIWADIRKAAGMPDLRIHDLRHSFASFGAGGGLSLQVVGKLLGHAQASTTERYSHLAADPIRAANEMIGKRIAAAMKPKPATGEVVDLAKTRETKPRRRHSNP